MNPDTIVILLNEELDVISDNPNLRVIKFDGEHTELSEVYSSKHLSEKDRKIIEDCTDEGVYYD